MSNTIMNLFDLMSPVYKTIVIGRSVYKFYSEMLFPDYNRIWDDVIREISSRGEIQINEQDLRSFLEKVFSEKQEISNLTDDEREIVNECKLLLHKKLYADIHTRPLYVAIVNTKILDTLSELKRDKPPLLIDFYKDRIANSKKFRSELVEIPVPDMIDIVNKMYKVSSDELANLGIDYWTKRRSAFNQAVKLYDKNRFYFEDDLRIKIDARIQEYYDTRNREILEVSKMYQKGDLNREDGEQISQKLIDDDKNIRECYDVLLTFIDKQIDHDTQNLKELCL